MVFSLPHSAAISDVSAANAAAASAIASSSAVSGPAGLFTSAVQANNFRLIAVYSRLSHYLNGGARFEASDAISLCHALAKAIDCSLTLKDIPGIASRLPPLVKKVYEWRKHAHAALQSAIMMVLISIKNACKRGWFQPADSEELLCIVNEMCSKFCTELCPNDQASYAFETISKIMPKFYPRLKLCSLIAAFEAKPGYDVLMSDFHFPKNKLPEQKIVLVVLKTEKLETSSCIASPPQVSLLINGRGVEKRNNVSLDCGPQFPTDISKMLKYGINVLQAIGYFDGTYLIAVAYMSRMIPFTLPALKDFVQPVVAAPDFDSEIIEGPSRISLNCPISFKRITIPVKGHLCKHHQCFDYVNFMEMNSRKPNWHCPYCNQPVCMIDLRIDQNMVKILEEVGKDVTEVIIHAGSSWNVVAEHKRDTNPLHDEAHAHDQADTECEANRPRNSLADPVDLTMEEEVSMDGSARQFCKLTSENEDRKPFIGDEVIPVSQFVAHPQLASHVSHAAQISALQLGNIMQPTFMSSYAVNRVAASVLPLGISQALPSNVLANHFTPDVISPVLGQTPLAVHALPVMGEVERIKGRSTPRHVDRIPIAVQPLPMPQSTPSTSRRLQANSLVTVPSASNNLSPNKYHTVHTSTATLENFNGGIGNMDLQQVTRTANTSAIQDHAQENHHYVPNAAVQQQVGGLPLSNSTNGRGQSLRRGLTDLDAFRASVQPSSFSQNSHQTLSDFWTQHSISQAVNVLPQSPSLPLAPWLVSQNTVTLSSGNYGNQHSQTQAPLPAQLSGSLSTSAANSQPSRDNSRVLGADRWRSLAGGMPSPLSRSDVFQELPSEQHNSMPTRIMRGRLTGNDYSAVLSRYMAPTGQSAITRPPFSSIPSTVHDQVSALIANNLMAHGTVSQQVNLSQDNFGTQQGDTCI